MFRWVLYENRNFNKDGSGVQGDAQYELGWGIDECHGLDMENSTSSVRFVGSRDGYRYKFSIFLTLSPYRTVFNI